MRTFNIKIITYLRINSRRYAMAPFGVLSTSVTIDGKVTPDLTHDSVDFAQRRYLVCVVHSAICTLILGKFHPVELFTESYSFLTVEMTKQ